VSLNIEQRARYAEKLAFRKISSSSLDWGPVLLRLGCAVTLGLSAFGGLPRHGTTLWTEPTLFVPDMQLSLVIGWDWLATAQYIIAIMLLFGFAIRLASLGVIGLALIGCVVFGRDFIMHYAFHFIAPALVLLICGAGKLSLDALINWPALTLKKPAPKVLWYLIQVMTGMTFVALAVDVKFLQPTLLIAILDHAKLNFFYIPTPWVALIMMMIEFLAGALLALGYLVRPISLFLLGAMIFFAVALGENPALHGNLFGLMLFLLAHGGKRFYPGLTVMRFRRLFKIRKLGEL
ncbi:MAG: hypothetical protein AAGA53_17850, partial [Pseudomonadota bacterium]